MNETRRIEAHLFGRDAPDEAVVFEARLILDADLRDTVRAQQQAYDLVRAYGRRQLRAEIEAVHHRLFHDPEHAGFRQRIFRLFHRNA